MTNYDSFEYAKIFASLFFFLLGKALPQRDGSHPFLHTLLPLLSPLVVITHKWEMPARQYAVLSPCPRVWSLGTIFTYLYKSSAFLSWNCEVGRWKSMLELTLFSEHYTRSSTCWIQVELERNLKSCLQEQQSGTFWLGGQQCHKTGARSDGAFV